ncbi:MAG: FkbM family methyltransferase [Bacteroidota bacterium]
MDMRFLKSLRFYLKTLLYKKFKSPIKKIKVGEFLLIANRESRLDEFLERHKNYSRNFSKLVKQILIDDMDSLIIDIGANIGDTVALLRSEKVVNPILCIEGNPFYLNLFDQNIKNFDNVTLLRSFLSDKTEELNVQVFTNEGTAKIEKNNDGILIKMTTLDELINNNQIENIRILKVDTDGFDILILTGAKEVVEKNQPVIFFEYDNDLNSSKTSCLSYLLSLRDKGYQNALFYDNLGNFLISLDLSQVELIRSLDKYINKDSAFQYYDVAVFHEKDKKLAENIVATLLEYN